MSKLVSCDECYSQKQYCEECSKINSEICDHKFDINSCNEDGSACCSECGKGFNELRSE